ncbi:MAG: hypothetical protein KTR31_24710 [Myxococcales bacterium]|nr:hypothetical protein [Myxococcales bacterium]
MATRLDRVTSTSSKLEGELDLAPTALTHRRGQEARSSSSRSGFETVALAGADTEGRHAVPERALGGAMAAWLGLTFGICYVVLPALMAILGWNTRVISGLWFHLPAFAMASFVAIVGTLVAAPRVRLSLRDARDPVVAATLGGFGVWAVVHNMSGLLMPFTALSAVELATLVGINVVEMGMLGMMFASFTKRASVALALGGSFQIAMLGLALTLMALV